MKALALTLFALCAATPALGAETAWFGMTPDVRVRLISDDTLSPAGTTRIGLEVEMPLTTNTYWRVPGETGIPIVLDLMGSEGITGQHISWPFPHRDDRSGYLDNVYFGPIILPVTLNVAGQGGFLRVSLTMGVCEEICMPVMAQFELPLSFGTPDLANGLRITQAEALAPIPWDQPGPAFGPVSFDTARMGLVFDVTSPSVEIGSIIADMGANGPLFGAPQKSPDGQSVLLPLLGKADPAALAGAPVQLTFMTAMGPYDLSAPVGLDLSTQAKW